MDRLDLSDGFDVHDYRAKLKLRRQDAGSMTLDNRDGLACPACDRPFERLFVTDDDEVTFEGAPGGPICLARTAERLLVLTH
ncbi:DUF7385 family protein [Halorarum halobium]|uniref:DUF7385 family protein n=1 Tax=Halorarum halobium TaxID=3075121 RepID=UPI0028B180F1|nr:flagella cluster protein [Halobaculum sp. XH14]